MSLNTNSRIAKNTLFLYVRMIVTMLVTLYTARVVLAALGETDYGIYNVIGGIVVLFSFLNTAMSNATQRFLSYELGRGNNNELRDTFSMSLSCHAIMALMVLVIAETVGLWFVTSKMNIPEDRYIASLWVYQFSVLTFVIGILRVPYNACIISNEKMSFYAYLSIIDVLLNLLIAYLIVNSSFDKLIFYAFLKLLVTVLCWAVNFLYCKFNFYCCKYRVFFDKLLFRRLISFSGWSMLSGGSVLVTQNFCNIILNIFHGVTINAAYGIANQVSSAIYGFVSNFQMAFQPQIVKLYAENKRGEQTILVNRASLISYFLLLLIGIPFCLEVNYILDLWLKDVPDFAPVFCIWMLIYSLIDAIQAPLWMAISSTGNIKVYSIWSSIFNLITLPIVWIVLSCGASPVYVFVVRVIVNLVVAIIRTIYINYFMNFPSQSYLDMVIYKALPVTIISFIIPFGLKSLFPSGFLPFIVISILSICTTLLSSFYIGFSKQERLMVTKMIISKIKK